MRLFSLNTMKLRLLLVTFSLFFCMEANANDGKGFPSFGLGPAVGYETGSLNGEDLEGVSYQLRAFKCFAPIHTPYLV